MVRAMLLAVTAALAAVTVVPPAPVQAFPVQAFPVQAVPTLAVPTLAAPTPAADWGWPLEPEPAVVAAFRASPTPWGAGHRGVDLAAAVGQPVLAAGGGRVTFAGVVAGRGVLVITHPGGWRTSYEPVDLRAPTGTAVLRGDQVAVVAATTGHCAPLTCLHWGARRGAAYVDPLGLVDLGPPVLLPLD